MNELHNNKSEEEEIFLRYDFYDSLLCNENAFIETKETIQLVVEYLKNELNED